MSCWPTAPMPVGGFTAERARTLPAVWQSCSLAHTPAFRRNRQIGRSSALLYWLQDVVRPARKPKTYQGYEVVVRVHLIPALGRKRLQQLTAVDVRQFLRRLENAEPTPSPRLVQQVHAVLRNALAAAMREELIGRNVASLVRVSAPSYEVNRGLTVDQARQLLTAAEDDRFHALYVLALYLVSVVVSCWVSAGPMLP